MATATVANGTLTMVYCNDAGAVTFTPSAAINNATAAAFLVWAKAYYIATPGASTSPGAFNTWFNEIISTTTQRMTQAAQSAAADTATKAVVPPVITPAQ